MDTFMVFVAYPLEFDKSDGMRWVNHLGEIEIDAENQDAANAIVQKKIDAGELNALMILPDMVGNEYAVRPFMADEEMIKKDRREYKDLSRTYKKE